MTDSVAAGDDPSLGLGWLTERGFTTHYATTSRLWPTETVKARYVAVITRKSPEWHSTSTLDGDRVAFVSPRLTTSSLLDGPVYKLTTPNWLDAYRGSFLNDGGGFLIAPQERRILISVDPAAAARLRPAVNSTTLSDTPSHAPLKYVIDLRGLSEADARKLHPALTARAERVKEHRKNLSETKRRVKEDWWLPEAKAKTLEQRLSKMGDTGMTLVPSFAETSVAVFPAMVPVNSFFQHDVFVFPSNVPFAVYSALAAHHHFEWTLARGGRLGVGSTPRYSQKHVFYTFPWAGLRSIDSLSELGHELLESLSVIQQERECGLRDAIRLLGSALDASVLAARRALSEINAVVESDLAEFVGVPPRALHEVALVDAHGPAWRPAEEAERTIDLLVRANHLCSGGKQ